MEIISLGNGGAINNGLHYNAFIINEEILCETPPDIMYTLHKNKINPMNIKTLFISHLHGDHIFGLPFLVLELFFKCMKNNFQRKLKIFGPSKIKKHSIKLIEYAFTKQHPCLPWFLENTEFIEISEKNTISFIPGYNIQYFSLIHPVVTYGFKIFKKNPILCYISDTVWSSKLEKILKDKPEIVIIDMNGKKDDIQKVHISIDDVNKYCIPITGKLTQYYGTHLKEELKLNDNKIRILIPGMRIKINEDLIES